MFYLNFSDPIHVCMSSQKVGNVDVAGRWVSGRCVVSLALLLAYSPTGLEFQRTAEARDLWE